MVSEIWVLQSLAQLLPDLTSFGPWASPCGSNGQIYMTLHNYRSRQVHETLNEVNPSSGFIYMYSAKYGPNLCQIWQVLGPWASPYGANWQMTLPFRGPYNSIKLWVGKSVKRLQSGSHTPAHPSGPWRQYNALIVGIHHKIPKLFPDFSIAKNFP